MALRAEEGRGKQRNAPGSGKQALIRGYPNGATRRPKRAARMDEYIVHAREPGELKHLSTPRRRNQKRFPK